MENTLNVSPGKLGVREVTYVECANCGARVKCEDNVPSEICCGEFKRK